MPVVSIVIPCFNLGAYLPEAVDSVLRQTYQDFEILIVDDGSTDPPTRQLLESYRPPRTRIMRTENRGLAEARNLGLREGMGRYFSFLDADDLLAPSFLERTVGMLEADPALAFASCWLAAFGDAEYEWTPARCDFPHLLAEDTVCTAALTRRDALLAVGGFDPRMPVAGYEDWDLAIGLLELDLRGAIVPEFLFRYRIRAGSMSESCTEPSNHARLMEYLIEKHARSYRRYYSGVIGAIEGRLAAHERALANPPPRPAVPAEIDPGDGEASWKEALLTLENHRRRVEALVQSGEHAPSPIATAEQIPADESAAVDETAWVEILDVYQAAPDPQRLRGCHIDVPRPGSRADARWFEVIGWALTREGPVAAIELLYGDVVFKRVPPGVLRPDLAAAFPQIADADRGGFRARFSLLGTAAEFDIRLRAVLEDESTCDMGVVRGRHSRHDSPTAPNRVSVVILGQDQAPIPSAAIDSVLSQSYPAVEVILVAGAAMATGHPGLRLIQTELPDAAARRAVGVAHTAGAYLCVLEAGESLAPDFLAQAVRRLDADPSVAFVTSRLGGGADAQPCDLLDVLGGAAPGSIVVFRMSALQGPCEFDLRIEDRRYAQWDLCISLLEAGLVGVSLPEAGDPSAWWLARGWESEAARYIFDKHSPSYNQHLVAALLRQEESVRRLLQRSDELERQAALWLRPAIGRWREELDLLDRKLRLDRRPDGGRDAGAGPRAFDWGDFRRLTPVSPVWGSDRGLCIDRYYIERFLEANAADICGAVLEVHDSIYTYRYGGKRIARADVIDINPLNPKATIVADLCRAANIPARTYDCIILTQTLHLIYDMRAALGECRRILKPGGALLATIPCVNQVDAEAGCDGDYWRFTATAVRRLFGEFFPKALLDVQPCGNLPVCFAFLQGLAAHELGARELETLDPRHPLVVTVRAGVPRRADEEVAS